MQVTMSVQLEDKILGEKADYYCSSSSEEDDKTEERTSNKPHQPQRQPQTAQNTGPKGVLADWRRFKEMESVKNVGKQRELQRITEKLSLTCRTEAEDATGRAEEEMEELLLEEMEEDDIMRRFMGKRMEEMKAALLSHHKNSSFGHLFDIASADEFLNATEKDSQNSTVIILIYEEDISGCEAIEGCLSCLAEDYQTVKFTKVKASTVGASKRFRNLGLPTLQAYRKGELIGSFVRVTDELGEDLFADKLEAFLKEYGILPDSSIGLNDSRLTKKGPDEDSDSDFDID